jgi:hypothetical protein
MNGHCRYAVLHYMPLEIAHVTSAYDNVIQHVRKIFGTNNWRDNNLHVFVKEMTGRHIDIRDYVLERYSRQSKVIIIQVHTFQ